MQRHIKRVGGGLLAITTLWIALLMADIPKALDQADKSFLFIAKSFGYQDPPTDFITTAWAHPWFVILSFAVVFCIGVGISWLLEFLWNKFAAGNVSNQSESISNLDRISIFQLRGLAEKAGWPSDPDDAEWIKFAFMLRQAFVDGNMKAWGRKNISTVDNLVAAEPLVLIPPSHWAEFQIDVISLRNASQSIDVHTYNQNVSGWALRQGYRDLHVSENEARAVISKFGIFHSARIMADAATTIAKNAKDEKRMRARERMLRAARGLE